MASLTIAQDHYFYNSPMRARFQIYDLRNKTKLYEFNPFSSNPTSAQPLKMLLNRGLGHHGNCTVLFEDSDGVLDRKLLSTPCRIKVQLSKQDSNWTDYFHSLVRKSRISMHQSATNFYLLSSFGLGQRANERVVEFDRTTPRVLDDGVTLDKTDVQQQADEMLEDSLNDHNEYPSDIMEDQVEGSDGYNFLNESEVKNFGFNNYLHSIQSRFVTMQDLWNQLEDFTFGRIHVPYSGNVQFMPWPTPLGVKQGFILTRKANKSLDISDNTCEIVGMSFNQEDSFLVDSGYAGRMVGILQKDLTPDTNDPPSYSNLTSNLSFEIAQLVRFPTNPNWELWVTIQLQDGTDADRHVQRSRWRICRKNPDGTIMNVGGIVDSFYAYEEGYNITDGGIAWLKIRTGRTNIDSETDYWLILSSVNASATTGYWEWYHDNSENGRSATAAPNTSTATDGGAGWTYGNSGPSYGYRLIRFKDQPMTLSFDGAIKARSMIEQPLGTFNSQINNYYGAMYYLLSTGKYRSSPQRIYPGIMVRVPNRPPFEGDLFQIQVPEYNLSKPGKRAEYGLCSDVAWSFGNEPNENDGMTALGTKMLQLSIKTHPLGY